MLCRNSVINAVCQRLDAESEVCRQLHIASDAARGGFFPHAELMLRKRVMCLLLALSANYLAVRACCIDIRPGARRLPEKVFLDKGGRVGESLRGAREINLHLFDGAQPAYA